ncbi:hypothetical protein [Rhodanobacter geophilus]|uniref:Uncharacterized protein n=1 Tax=Rhodanobacter geophilus TaxID=3162488 RepID=A0ABV3QPP0_9GAMM
MSKINTKCALITCSLLLAISVAPSTSAQVLKVTTNPITPSNPIGILPPRPLPIPAPPSPLKPLDNNLYTTYTMSNSYTYLNWMVCGSTEETEGCYDFGSLGPFGRIGAIIEDNEITNYTTGTVTQNFYVVDQAANGGTGVTLYVYQRTDTITNSFDTTTMTLSHTIPLSLTGGTDATTYMAGNNSILLIGTNKSAYALEVQKSDFASRMVGGFSPPSNVSSITTSRYGYITVTFGDNGFYTLDPSGRSSGDGGGGDFMLNTTNGFSTGNSNIVSSATSPNLAARMQVHMKQQPTSQVNP